MRPREDVFEEGVQIRFVACVVVEPQPSPEHKTLRTVGGSYQKVVVDDTDGGAFATVIRTDKAAPSPSGAMQLSDESSYRITFTHCAQPPGKPDIGPPSSTRGGIGSDTLRLQPADTEAATRALLQPQDVGDPGIWYPNPFPDMTTRVPPVVGIPADADAALMLNTDAEAYESEKGWLMVF